MKTAQITSIEVLKNAKEESYAKVALAGIQGYRYAIGEDYRTIVGGEGRTITFIEDKTAIKNVAFAGAELRKEVANVFGSKDASIVAQVCTKVAGNIMANQKEYDGLKLIEIAKDVAEAYKQVVKILASNP